MGGTHLDYMAEPLSPPPTNEYGAVTQPRQLERWLDVNPVTQLTRTQAYITLPAFSIEYVWLGYSDIIASFNFEGPNNFSLIQINGSPSLVFIPSSSSGGGSDSQTGNVIGADSGGGMV